MKKISFLAKLQQQKRLQLVEPSEEVAEAYLQKSEKSLKSAKATFEIENYEDSVALAYYSMYYSVLALFFRIGVKCENHTAALLLLKEIFAIDNGAVLKAKDERVDKQYYVDFSVTKEEVLSMIKLAEEFNSQILQTIATLQRDKIQEYREKTAMVLKEYRIKNSKKENARN